jgi:hypothetical protein
LIDSSTIERNEHEKANFERIIMRELTYWKTVGAALIEGRHLHHVLVAGEVCVLHGEESFLEGEHREVSLGVAVAVDLDRRSGDAWRGERWMRS